MNPNGGNEMDAQHDFKPALIHEHAVRIEALADALTTAEANGDLGAMLAAVGGLHVRVESMRERLFDACVSGVYPRQTPSAALQGTAATSAERDAVAGA